MVPKVLRMKRITACLKDDRPILREVLHYLVTNAGMEVVGQSSDSLDLLCSVDRVRPEVVFLWTSDALKQPGIVSHLQQEFPHLKVVVVSSDHFTISDVGIRTRKFSELSMDSIRASVVESLAQ
jgi:DNA-binding NarL/FixJ family response regulator